MVALSRCIVSAALLLVSGAEAARVGRKKHEQKLDTKIVLFHEGVTTADIHEFCAGRCNLIGNPDLGGVAFAQISSAAGAQAMTIAQAKKVEVYEEDVVDYAIPEVEEMSAAKSASWGLDYVGVPDRAFTGKGQTIYVQDTGVRVSHADFGGRAYAAIDLTSNSLVECGASARCAVDEVGHGTHCAGTAGGTTYGVASDAAVAAIKTLEFSGGQRSWNIAAIDWVVTKGAKPSIMSLSLGGSGQDPAYTRAISAANAVGVTIVVAAGNFGSDACDISPAFDAGVITVGATEGSSRAGYSNFGTCVDIMAPGSAITSAGVMDDKGSKSMTGTSMACPHVSGAAALLLEYDNSLKKDQIFSIMTQRGRKGYVTGLKADDPDLFLWVSAKDAPTAAPTPPPPACGLIATGPDSDGDCKCPTAYDCYEGSRKGCPYSRPGNKSVRYFSDACSECECKRR